MTWKVLKIIYLKLYSTLPKTERTVPGRANAFIKKSKKKIFSFVSVVQVANNIGNE